MDPSLERYSRQMRFYGIGEAGQTQAARVARDAVRLRRAGHGAGQRPGARRRRPRAHRRSRLRRDEQPATPGAVRRARRGRATCPRPRRPRRKLRGDQLDGRRSSRSSPTSTARTSSSCASDADLILDGTDNFEIRYLINDVAVKLNKPWVYGGCIGSHGQTMTILPGQTPCLRCVFEAAPGAGRGGHVRDGRRAGADRQHRRQLPGDRGDQDPDRATRRRSTAS